MKESTQRILIEGTIIIAILGILYSIVARIYFWQPETSANLSIDYLECILNLPNEAKEFSSNKFAWSLPLLFFFVSIVGSYVSLESLKDEKDIIGKSTEYLRLIFSSLLGIISFTVLLWSVYYTLRY